jgi:hypothetical protein
MSGVVPTSSEALRKILGVLSKALQLRHARSMSPPALPALRHAPPHPASPYPRILGYSSIWGCIPIYWGIPAPYTWGITIYGDAFPYIWVPHYMGMYSHILGYPWGIPVYEDASPHIGVPHYMCMHSQILGYPSTWGCIPIYRGIPVYEDACPHIWVPNYMGMHSHILGCPII